MPSTLRNAFCAIQISFITLTRSLVFSVSFTEEKGSQVFLAEPKNSKIFTVDRGKGAGRISISSEIGHLSIRFKPFPPKCARDKTASGLRFLPACTPLPPFPAFQLALGFLLLLPLFKTLTLGYSFGCCLSSQHTPELRGQF